MVGNTPQRVTNLRGQVHAFTASDAHRGRKMVQIGETRAYMHMVPHDGHEVWNNMSVRTTTQAPMCGVGKALSQFICHIARLRGPAL